MSISTPNHLVLVFSFDQPNQGLFYEFLQMFFILRLRKIVANIFRPWYYSDSDAFHMNYF